MTTEVHERAAASARCRCASPTGHGRARRARAFAGAVILGGALALAAACLPDLAAFPAGPDAGAVTEEASTCGDGVIDLPEDGGDGGESCDPGEAGAAGCEFCRFTCSGGIDDAGHCYFFADPTSTYNDAVIACRGAAGHVVTLASKREADFVSGLTQDASAHWVGLLFDLGLNGYKTPSNEPGWPDEGQSCPGCYALGADDAGGFPLAAGADASVTNACLISEDGGWAKVECSGAAARTTLCEREPIGQRIYPCGGLLCMTIPPTETTKRYVVWPSPVAAEQARSLCEGSDDGGSLVVLDTPEEREQLARELRQRLPLDESSSIEAWIGLSQVDGGWLWDDGVDRPQPWGEGQPGAGTGRAFLRINDLRLDTELARADESGVAPTKRYLVCERPP